MKTACTDCGVIEQDKGRTDPATGDDIFSCISCGYEWVAPTAMEEQDQARIRMDEAITVLNPVLRSFLKSKL